MTELNRYAYSVLNKSSDSRVITWDGNPAIFCKYDWFTCIFDNISVLNVLSLIGLDDLDTLDLNDFFMNQFISPVLSGSDVNFTYNGLMLSISSFSVFHDLECNSLEDLKELNPHFAFSTRFDHIRLDISGSGLDFLRQEGIAIDEIISSPFVLSGGSDYHTTRCDVAFDLLNYMPEFLDKCKEACVQFQDKRTFRVPVFSGSVKWSSRSGDQNTLYLGATGSDKLLRIYDKKLQYEKRGTYFSDCPYQNGDQRPISWIRIELQTRREQSMVILYNCKNFEQRFRYIYEKYAMRDIKYSYDYRNVPGDVLPFWDYLFDFSKIPDFRHNANFVQLGSVLDRSISYVYNQSYVKQIVLMGQFGCSEYNDSMKERFVALQKSELPSDKRKFNRILSDWFNINNGNLPDFVYKDEMGIFYLK